MRLLACHIENFGKLSDFRMDFQESVNIVTEPNGWGKSTLAAFLKAMLYGFDNRKEEGAFEKERKVYTPWQGGVYGGELDIEVKDRRYRICRYFGATERADSFHLYDLDTNLECTDFSSNIGTELFDIDRSSFKKTIYVAQNDCTGGTSDSINAKLGNLAAASDDINNYENAVTEIRDRMNHLSPKRATGSLKRRVNLIAQLQQEKKGLDAAAGAVDQVRMRLEEKQQQYQEIVEIRSEYARSLRTASEDSRRKEQLNSYGRLCNDEAEKKQRMEECAARFPAGVPEDDMFRRGRELIRDLEEKVTVARQQEMTREDQAEIAQLHKQFHNALPESGKLDEMTEKALRLSEAQHRCQQSQQEAITLERQSVQASGENYIDPNPAKSSLPLAGILLAAVGVAAALFGLIGGGVTAADSTNRLLLIAGVILVVLGAVLYFAGRRKNSRNAQELAHRLEERDRQSEERDAPLRRKKEEIEKQQKEITSLEEELKDFFAPYDFISSDISWTEKLYELRVARSRYQDLEARQEGHYETFRAIDTCSTELGEVMDSLGLKITPTMGEDLSALQTRATEYRMAAQEYERAVSRREEFEAANDMDALRAPEECAFTLEELQEMIQEADNNIEALRGIVAQYNHQMEDLQQQLDLRDEKEQDLKAAIRLQAEETREYDMLEKTSIYLRRAKEAFVARYMGPITTAFGKYYAMLTGETSDEWMIDANLCLKLREQGLMREVRWLSAGYRDLLGICLRMAVIDAMYPGEKPFLIFDDPFVNLDNRKLKNGLHLLKQLGEEYQIVYFTCHDSRKSLEDGLDD